MNTPHDELLLLLSHQSERELTDSEAARISELLRGDESLIDVYVDYMSVQSLLMWDTGYFPAAAQSPSLLPESAVTLSQVADPLQPKKHASSRSLLAVVVAVVALVTAWDFVATNSQHGAPTANTPEKTEQNTTVAAQDRHQDADTPAVELKPLQLGGSPRRESQQSPAESTVADSLTNGKTTNSLVPEDFDDHFVATEIDRLITATLKENDVKASPAASDAEWLRRVYLTVAGRIPTVSESKPFIESDSPRKRNTALDHVLNLPARSRNLAVIWTNLLVGRSPKQFVNRKKLYDYLAKSFGQNKPWIDTVGELITARGRSDENGATNFLLAHLNNQATPATAVTSKLFLGEQVSCVQCHDHPFSQEIKQEHYWALNAFFKDTDRTSIAADAGGDSMRKQKSKQKIWQLVDRRKDDRMTYFENRKGEQRATLPEFAGVAVDRDSEDNRRDSLAELLAADPDAKVARAMVNRMWSHFFGYGFTLEVDDMGPHVAVSHPELLDLLSEAFVKSGYDMKRLMKWIGSSNAWQRSSLMIAENSDDRPDHGMLPLFSRVYMQRMTPEQVYESIRTAIRSSAGVPVDVDDDEAADTHRRQWVAQFARSYNTDENDESMDFDGSIAQAMVMMNNGEVSQAISEATHAMLGEAGSSAAIAATLKQIALAMLTREPTADEQKIFRSRYRQLAMNTSPKVAMPNAIQDMMWVYLNTSEFVLIH